MSETGPFIFILQAKFRRNKCRDGFPAHIRESKFRALALCVAPLPTRGAEGIENMERCAGVWKCFLITPPLVRCGSVQEIASSGLISCTLLDINPPFVPFLAEAYRNPFIDADFLVHCSSVQARGLASSRYPFVYGWARRQRESWWAWSGERMPARSRPSSVQVSRGWWVRYRTMLCASSFER